MEMLILCSAKINCVAINLLRSIRYAVSIAVANLFCEASMPHFSCLGVAEVPSHILLMTKNSSTLKASIASKLEASCLRNIPPIFSYLTVILGLFRGYIGLVLAYLFQMQMEFNSTLVGFYNKHEPMFVTIWCLEIS